MIRSEADLQNHPCIYKIKDFEKAGPVGGIHQVKKIVPKLDEQGNQIFKEVPIKKGCGCKGKQVEVTMQKIPETTEIYVEELINNNQDMVLCKLFGTVNLVHCQNCKTYKAK